MAKREGFDTMGSSDERCVGVNLEVGGLLCTTAYNRASKRMYALHVLLEFRRNADVAFCACCGWRGFVHCYQQLSEAKDIKLEITPEGKFSFRYASVCLGSRASALLNFRMPEKSQRC
jgi:hypothetical protein